MALSDDAALVDYPRGRGYGQDYMRGGEVLGGYGYAEREEYSKPRGELAGTAPTPTKLEPNRGEDDARSDEQRRTGTT